MIMSVTNKINTFLFICTPNNKILVEMTRIELVSEYHSTKNSPSAVYLLEFPHLNVDKQTFKIGNFINTHYLKVLIALFPLYWRPILAKWHARSNVAATRQLKLNYFR